MDATNQMNVGQIEKRTQADVMAVEAGREPLDYSAWDADRERYFAAIRAATGRDYGVMRELVRRALGD